VGNVAQSGDLRISERTLIKMKLKYIESEHADWIHLLQDASKWRAVLNITWLEFGYDIYLHV
jgi:hypothetical protein